MYDFPAGALTAGVFIAPATTSSFLPYASIEENYAAAWKPLQITILMLPHWRVSSRAQCTSASRSAVDRAPPVPCSSSTSAVQDILRKTLRNRRHVHGASNSLQLIYNFSGMDQTKPLTSLTILKTKNECTWTLGSCEHATVSEFASRRRVIVRMPFLPLLKVRWPNSVCPFSNYRVVHYHSFEYLRQKELEWKRESTDNFDRRGGIERKPNKVTMRGVRIDIIGLDCSKLMFRRMQNFWARQGCS